MAVNLNAVEHLEFANVRAHEFINSHNWLEKGQWGVRALNAANIPASFTACAWNTVLGILAGADALVHFGTVPQLNERFITYSVIGSPLFVKPYQCFIRIFNPNEKAVTYEQELSITKGVTSFLSYYGNSLQNYCSTIGDLVDITDKSKIKAYAPSKVPQRIATLAKWTSKHVFSRAGNLALGLVNIVTRVVDAALAVIIAPLALIIRPLAAGVTAYLPETYKGGRIENSAITLADWSNRWAIGTLFAPRVIGDTFVYATRVFNPEAVFNAK